MSAASLHHHICLICGCNTNQTINIYEPRSGPNIVELIQAKFKFQPLNEDKYLCFSCNNWLINWHSLQANNSNDAESPSGTFRSSQVNGGMAQEKQKQDQNHSQQHQQQHQQQQQYHHHRHHHWQKGTQTNVAVCRPIAQVRPRQLTETDKLQSKPEVITLAPLTTSPKSQSNAVAPSKLYTKISYAKRSEKCTHRHRRLTKKYLSHCCLCGRAIVFYIRTSAGALSHPTKQKRTAKCRKCRSVWQWRSIYMRSLTKERSNGIKLLKYKPLTEDEIDAAEIQTATATAPAQNLVNQVDNNTSDCPSVSRNQSQYLKRPLVDGKVVAMLRRLGTTLSRENAVSRNAAEKLPPIMSPTKPSKSRWTRPLEADEILLNFETAISEVLPTMESENLNPKQTPTRRKLTYQISRGSDCETPQSDAREYTKPAYQDLLNSLPKGLDVSLI